jgi:hypothetical protein
MQKVRTKQASGWSYVQPTILVLSILLNLFQWLRAQEQSKKINAAQYNDSAWEALADFDNKTKQYQDTATSEVFSVVEDALKSKDYKLGLLLHIDREWSEKAIRDVTELRTKLKSYQALCSDSLSVFPFAARSLSYLRPPSELFLVVVSLWNDQLPLLDGRPAELSNIEGVPKPLSEEAMIKDILSAHVDTLLTEIRGAWQQ